MSRENRWLVPLLVGPALAFILVGSLVPIAATAWQALHGHDLRLPWLGRPFIGLDNFIDGAMRSLVGVSTGLVLSGPPFAIVLGSLAQTFAEVKTAGVDVHLLDCVSPERTPQQKTPLASDNMAQMCRGGSARLAEALVTDIRQHGGSVRTSVEPRSILVRDGRAYGVELTSGERIETRGFIASGLNPQQTFLKLIDADSAGPSLREQAASFEYNLLAPLFALNLALRERPRYAAADRDPRLHQAFMIILGLERFDQFHDIVQAHESGQLPGMVMWGACPTQFDPRQAPPGGHTAFMWEKVPFAVDKYISAVENRPSNRAVTHHSSFRTQPLVFDGVDEPDFIPKPETIDVELLRLRTLDPERSFQMAVFEYL
jgi:hypothetical protein